jgi:vacuolar-type H+-ATPase subunit H
MGILGGINQVIEDAQHGAEGILKAANEKQQKIIKGAQDQAHKILHDVDVKQQAVIKDAQNKAEDILKLDNETVVVRTGLPALSLTIRS